MKVFVNDIPFILSPITNMVNPQDYQQVLRPAEHSVAKADLRGRVLILQPTEDLVRLVLERMMEGKYPDLMGVTLAVEDYVSAMAMVKDRFTILEAGGGVAEKDGKVLMIFRLGKWDLPKGKIEKGETPEEGALREVEEECSVTVAMEEPIVATWHTYRRNGKDILKKSYWYRMTCEDDEHMEPQYEEDIEQVVWLTRSEVEQVMVNSYNSIRFVMEEYYRQFRIVKG